jgi:hypothetical protein
MRYAIHILVSVDFNFGTLTGKPCKLDELDIHAHSMP